MIYLIGGTSRSGKSNLRKKLLEKHGISGISTDRLVQMLQVGMPNFGLTHDTANDMRVSKLRPLIQGLLTYHADAEDFVIEGVDILPEDVSNYMKYATAVLRLVLSEQLELLLHKKLKIFGNFPATKTGLSI